MIQRYILGRKRAGAVYSFFGAMFAASILFSSVRADPAAATYTGPGSDYGDSVNWGGTTPGSTQNLVVDQDATLVVSGSQQTLNLGVVAGTTGITLNNTATLVLNSSGNGTLSVSSGATVGVAGAGTLQAAVIEAGGTLNLATTTILDGGANPNPVRDGSSPTAVSRYGLVVLGGGLVSLESGADVTLAQAGKVVGVRVGEGAGTGTLAIKTGSNITVGTATDRGFFVVGDFGSSGIVNQTGGTLSVVGAVNVGSQGGTGTYNLSGGTVNVGLYEDGSDSNGFSVGARRTGSNAAPNGTLNISGTGELILTRGYLLVGGDTSPTSGGTGVVNQTGGLVRIIKDGLALGSGASGTANGTYNLNGGVLELGGTNGIQGGGSGGGTYAFNFGGGTLKVYGRNLTSSAALTLVDGTTSTIDTAGLDATFSAFGGTGAFLKTGEGTMTLSGTSNIGKVTAGTWVPTVSTVDEGTLAVTGSTTVKGILAANGTEAAFGNAKTATVALANGASLTIGDTASPGSYLLIGYGAGKTGAFSMTGGTLTVAGVEGAPFPGSGIAVGDNDGSGRFTMSAGTIDLEDGGKITNLSVGTGGGSGEFTQSGGTVNLGTNFSVGAGTGSTGTYTLSGSAVLNAIPSAGSTIVYIGDNGGTGTLEINDSAVVNFGASSSLWIGGIDSNANSGSTGTVTQNGGTVNFAGNYFQLGGKAGDTGTYNLNGGTLAIGGTSGIRAGNGTANFNLGGGTLKVNGADLTTTVRANLVNNTVSTINTNGFNATFANGLAGAGGFSKTGAGALTLNGTTDLQAESNVSGVLKVGAGAGKSGTLNLSDALTVKVTTSVGRLQVGVDGGTGTANFTTGASFVIDDSAAAGGWGTLDIGRGAGSIGVLNHSAGTVDVSGGALQIGYSGGIGAYHLSGDATLDLGASSSIFIGSGANAEGLLTIADNAVFTADSQVFVGAGAGATGTITQAGGSVTFTGPIVTFGTDSDETSHSPGTGIYNLEAGTLLFEGIVQGVRFGDSAYGGAGEFNQSGGTVTLTNTTLRVGAYGSYNQSGGVMEVGGTNLTGSGAYRFGGGTIKVVGSALTTGLNSTLTSGKILTVDTNGLGATFSGSFTGAGGLTKMGLGVLRLTGTSDYAGATTITNGTFQVDGTLTATTITVGAGATLAGHGTVAHVNILNGGKVDLGDTTGMLNATGDFSLGDTSHLLLKIASAADYDQITIGGALNAGGIFELVFINGYNPLGEASFSLLIAQTYNGGFDHLVLPDLAEGLEWNTDAMNSAGVLSIVGTAIPEPTTWAGLAGVAVLAVAVWRRRGVIRKSMKNL
jgi:fibronectin-binding autotransporter adhesin